MTACNAGHTTDSVPKRRRQVGLLVTNKMRARDSDQCPQKLVTISCVNMCTPCRLKPLFALADFFLVLVPHLVVNARSALLLELAQENENCLRAK